MISLIPRNNWDYGFSQLLTSLAGVFSNGKRETALFEKTFSAQPLFSTSGRASLYAILKSLNAPPGAPIGVPLFCCQVVFDAIKQAGFTARFIDVDDTDYTISAADLEKKRQGLAAVIAVHMFGHPADVDSLKSIAPGAPIIEDCALSLFSTYKGKLAGTLADASFFSFRSGKYGSVGEGSMVLAANPKLRTRIATLIASFAPWKARQMAQRSLMTLVKSTLYHRPWYGLVGYPVGTALDKKYNLTGKGGFDLHAIAASDLHCAARRLIELPALIERQRSYASRLKEKISAGKCVLPEQKPCVASNWIQFALRFKDQQQRDFCSQYLFARGIDNARYLDEIIKTARREHGYTNDCPVAKRCSRTVLLIPCFYTLSSVDIDRIAATVNEALERMPH